MTKLKMPDFQTEAEEAKWWFDNQDQIAVEAFQQMGEELLVLDTADAELGKAKAAACGMAYEDYMRDLVHRALHEQQAAWASMQPVDISEKFGRFNQQWRPKTIAELNGQEVKLVKVQGTFPWHHHEAEDEMFLVWRGRFRVEFLDRVVELGPGGLIVVPHGVEHRTAADEEAEVIIFEPSGMRNTGNVVDETYTAPTGAKL